MTNLIAPPQSINRIAGIRKLIGLMRTLPLERRNIREFAVALEKSKQMVRNWMDALTVDRIVSREEFVVASGRTVFVYSICAQDEYIEPYLHSAQMLHAREPVERIENPNPKMSRKGQVRSAEASAKAVETMQAKTRGYRYPPRDPLVAALFGQTVSA